MPPASANAAILFAVGSPPITGQLPRPITLKSTPVIAIRRVCSISAVWSTVSGLGSCVVVPGSRVGWRSDEDEPEDEPAESDEPDEPDEPESGAVAPVAEESTTVGFWSPTRAE